MQHISLACVGFQIKSVNITSYFGRTKYGVSEYIWESTNILLIYFSNSLLSTGIVYGNKW